MIDDFEQRWRQVIQSGAPGTREVDAESHIRLVCGMDAMARPLFFIVVDRKPGLPRLSGAVSVERRQRQDGKWTLTLILENSVLVDPFISLATDIALRCVALPSEDSAVQTFLETVEEWQELLSARFDRLSEDALRGLMAELWFGFECPHHGHPLDEVVMSWSGPFRGDQDYNFPVPGTQFEVKSIRPNRESIEISSTSQLDLPEVQLAVVTLDWAPDGVVGVTLPTLVARIRSSFAEPVHRAEFDRRFAQLMVNLNDPWYQDLEFQVQRLRVFDAPASFPALRSSELPDAITRAQYRIDLAHVANFLLTDESFTPSDIQGAQA